MGLMDTVVKVGLGIAIAKGMDAMKANKAGGGRGGLGGMMDELQRQMGGAATAGQTTGQAGRGTPYSAPGGLGGMMDQILGGGRQAAPRANAPRGGLNDLIVGGAAGGALGGLLGGAADAKEDTLEAALYLRCMIAAAKADHELDAGEKARIMETVGEASKDEIAFINAELAAQTDVEALARQVPQGMEEKAYLASLMAIDLDQRAEAEFLDAFARALELSRDEVKAIHQKAGAPQIYQ
jgi:uncharacterized membrane protein YebE (DUF533 family)